MKEIVVKVKKAKPTEPAKKTDGDDESPQEEEKGAEQALFLLNNIKFNLI